MGMQVPLRDDPPRTALIIDPNTLASPPRAAPMVRAYSKNEVNTPAVISPLITSVPPAAPQVVWSHIQQASVSVEWRRGGDMCLAQHADGERDVHRPGSHCAVASSLPPPLSSPTPRRCCPLCEYRTVVHNRDECQGRQGCGHGCKYAVSQG